MAFSNTITHKISLPGGLILERGTWAGTGVTTGTITADTATGNPDLVEVLMFSASSDTDDVVKSAEDQGPNKLKLTFTNNDTGKYSLLGRCA